MKQQLLLLEDVDGLGRQGDLVTAKSGFIRNFLLPKKKAVIADKGAMKLQTNLKEKREKQAKTDLNESEKLLEKLAAAEFVLPMKVDTEQHLYGSVTSLEIGRLLTEKGYALDRKNIALNAPIKALGSHRVPIKLKEGVMAMITLEVVAEET